MLDESSAPIERSRSIRVVSYPDDHRNPYFSLFYGALKQYGVSVDYTGGISDRMLTDTSNRMDVLHFHWGLEHLWRWRKQGRLSEAMGLVGWARFLLQAKRKGVRVVWT